MNKNSVLNPIRMTAFAGAAAMVLASSGVANATLISQTFWGAGTDSGGIVTFDDDLGGNQLRITFDNTSLYDALITGIVFNVSEDIAGATIGSFTDGDGTDITSLWTVGLNVDNNTTPGNTVFDVAFETLSGVNGGIYNDGVATSVSASMFPDIATLILNISDPDPWSLLSLGTDSILRTQQTGANGEGSDKIVTSSSSNGGGGGSTGNGVPEPGVLALLGIGLLGQALLMRQRRRRVK